MIDIAKARAQAEELRLMYAHPLIRKIGHGAADLLRELAAEPERVPLTDEQGIALANSVSPGNDNTWIRDPDQCVLRIVRATEVAHGITGDAK